MPPPQPQFFMQQPPQAFYTQPPPSMPPPTAQPPTGPTPGAAAGVPLMGYQGFQVPPPSMAGHPAGAFITAYGQPTATMPTLMNPPPMAAAAAQMAALGYAQAQAAQAVAASTSAQPYATSMANSYTISSPAMVVSPPSQNQIYSTPPGQGVKRKVSIPPSPEASPEGAYIGQHSQGIGGHYASSYGHYNMSKRAKY